jgi:hypothetical protein
VDPPELVASAPAEVLHARLEQDKTIFIVNDLLARADPAKLCEHVRSILDEQERLPIVCDLSKVLVADAATVDALCRLQLAVRRCGRAFELRHAGPELEELIVFMGLGETLTSTGG